MEQIDLFGNVLMGDFGEIVEIFVLIGEIEIYLFGDEFYLFVGVWQSFEIDVLDWVLLESEYQYDFIFFFQFFEIEGFNWLVEMICYFGVGVIVCMINVWDLILEGGVYFGDNCVDQMQIYDLEMGEMQVLFDDLDKVDCEVIGDIYVCLVCLVGYFVLW